ncbi:cell division protein FtsW [Candidatus Parcubacteria bacterium]|nr:MAG: cell division protein FtsW [Candidatus Parcubacteria bacterium]
MRRVLKADRVLFFTTIGLLLIGFFILASASMGLLARSASGGSDFVGVVFQQILFGAFGCLALFIFAGKIEYRHLAKWSAPFLLFTLGLTSLVFIPGIGFTHGGASRWISVGPLFFQPSEFLKLALVIYSAAWISSKRRKITDFKSGFLPFAGVLALAGFLLVLQRDLGTLGVMISTSVALFFLGKGKMKHFLLILGVMALAFAALVYFEPYRMSRVTVFLNPSHDPQGAGYQLRQSLIAIGSGGITGKGFGMSMQKFSYLPEPVSDSIFAVFSEEFGFFGSVGLIGLLVFFLYRGFAIAIRSPDDFGKLLGAGIVLLIVIQSFINISAMIGIFPLTGVPLVFVSKGGSSLVAALAASGVLLNISKYARM